MKTSTIIWIVVIVIIVLGGILWFVTQSSGATSPTSVATTTATTATSDTVNLGSNATIPSFLTAANGMAVYTFKSDKVGVSNCSGTCAVEWPPYTVSSATDLTAAPNISGTLATIKRADGTMQVTYNGMPLYFFVQDKNIGDVTGNGNDGFVIATATAAPAASVQTTPAATTKAAATVQTTAPVTAPSAPAYNY